MTSSGVGSRIALQSKTKVYTVQPMPRDLCPHRGHALQYSKCPYHGLTFPVPQGCFKQENVPRETTDDDWCEKIEDDLGASFFTYDMPVKAPASLWIQNTMDCNHLASVHADSLARVFSSYTPHHVCINESGSSWRLSVKPEVVDVYRGIIGDGVGTEFFHAVSYPSLSITSFLDVFYSFETVKPGKTETRIRTVFHLSKKNPAPRPLIDAAIEMNKKILLEDRKVVESWAQTYEDHKHVNFLKNEERIQAYLGSPHCNHS